MGCQCDCHKLPEDEAAWIREEEQKRVLANLDNALWRSSQKHRESIYEKLATIEVKE